MTRQKSPFCFSPLSKECMDMTWFNTSSSGLWNTVQSNHTETVQRTYALHDIILVTYYWNIISNASYWSLLSHSSGRNSAVHLHLRENNHSFADNNVYILAREDRWFEKRSKRIHLCQTGTTVFEGGLRHYISPTYSSLPRQLDNNSHLGSPSLSNPHEGRLASTTLKLRAHMCP